MARDLFRKKCAKCNITAAEDQNLSFHRFPLPGKHGMSRIRVWAEYCYPGEDWSSEKSLKDLHFQHKMVCSKHFDDSCYTNSARTRLNIFALPTGAQDLKNTNIPVDIPQLAKENNMELVKVKCEINKNILEPSCSSLKQEAEMDIYESIAGGRKFKTTSSGLRNSFTAKNDCPMNIKIKLSSDGQKLQIASLNENHNHNIIDKDIFYSLPKQRKLDTEEKNEAENLLQLKCNKKLLQAYKQNNTDMHAVLHGFPNPEKDRVRFDTWLYLIGSDILGLENAHKYKYCRVCHRHFQDKYICRNNRISNIAVPTLYLPDPETVVCEQVPPSTSQNLEPKSKVSADQTSILCNFFEDNPEVLRGYKRTPKCKDKVQIKWKNITPHLNAVGPPRDHRSWAKVKNF